MNNTTSTSSISDKMMNHYISIAGFSVSALIHMTGLNLLRRVRMHQNNQRLILINLALAELLSSVIQIAENMRYVFEIKGKQFNYTPGCYVERFIAIFTNIATKLIMLELVVDRLLDVLLNVKYPLYFRKRQIMKILTCLWSVSGAVSLALVLGYECFIVPEIIYTFLVCDVAIAITASITYTYFYVVVNKVIQRERRYSFSGGHAPTQQKRSKFMVPFLMMGTYLVFNLTGTAMFMVMLHINSKILHNVSVSLIFTGYISDGFIYIFCQKEVRTLWVTNLLKSWRDERRVSSSSTIPSDLYDYRVRKESQLSVATIVHHHVNQVGAPRKGSKLSVSSCVHHQLHQIGTARKESQVATVQHKFHIGGPTSVI